MTFIEAYNDCFLPELKITNDDGTYFKVVGSEVLGSTFFEVFYFTEDGYFPCECFLNMDANDEILLSNDWEKGSGAPHLSDCYTAKLPAYYAYDVFYKLMSTNLKVTFYSYSSMIQTLESFYKYGSSLAGELRLDNL